MSQRKAHDDLAFGSDSFLDVVANIVGILIILIVVAGLRVSRAPVVEVADVADPVESRQVASEPAELSVAAVAAPDLEPVESVPLPTPEPEWPQPVPVPALEPVPPPRPDPTPPPELMARATGLEQEIETLTTSITDRQNEQRNLQGRTSQTAAQLADLQQELTNAEATLDEIERETGSAATAVDSGERTLTELQAELLTKQANGPEPEVLSHRVTPMGRMVAGPELHFRLEGNRVSVVPIDALADELKNRIERNRDSLLRMQRYEGTVGPIDGYEMRYLMQQGRGSVLEELRFGRGFIKMSVVFWELIPQEGYPSESAEEAVRRGSRFYAALQRAGPDATITMWVYPDSFDLHRKLQEFAHSAGFDVAARPLPFGVPIAGSPNGSRSVAQ